MKKTLMILLLMVSTSVFSEWTRVSETANGEYISYVASKNIQKNGSKVSMWILNDYKTVHQIPDTGLRFLSTITHNEYDCEEGTTRFLDWAVYSENMAGGGISDSNTNIQRAPTQITPGSMEDAFAKIACSK
jgi:hypothetical protein